MTHVLLLILLSESFKQLKRGAGLHTCTLHMSACQIVGCLLVYLRDGPAQTILRAVIEVADQNFLSHPVTVY